MKKRIAFSRIALLSIVLIFLFQQVCAQAPVRPGGTSSRQIPPSSAPAQPQISLPPAQRLPQIVPSQAEEPVISAPITYATGMQSGIYPVQGREPIIYPPPLDAFRRLKPQPSAWFAWWEANRDPYLGVVRQGAEQKPDVAEVEDFRRQAIESLLAALASDSPALRAASSLALGDIGNERFLRPLTELANKDKEVKVRQAAILAIGLLDIPKGEQVLAEIAFKPLPAFENGFLDTPSDRQAALIALGLMGRLKPDTTVNLQEMCNRWLTMSPLAAWALTRPLDPSDPTAPILYRSSGINSQKQALSEASGLAVSAISCSLLARLDDPVSGRLLQEALDRTNVPWIASNAMLALGSRGDKASATGLADILLSTARGKSLPVCKALEEQNVHLTYLWNVRCSKLVCDDVNHGGRDATAANAYIAAFNRAIGGEVITRKVPGMLWGDYKMLYFQMHYGGEDYDEAQYKGQVIRDYCWLGLGTKKDISHMAYHVNLGVEPIFAANLRASAAIALGRIDGPVSRQALRKVLAEEDDDFSDAYKSMAIMSLGQLGDFDALPALTELVHPTAPRGIVISKERIQNPLRSFAALALGLYARPVATPQGIIDRKDYEKVSMLLAERADDVKEEQDVRAACALSLGLSGRTENLKHLQAAWKHVGEKDDLLTGYMILARGMLGDRTIVQPARTFLADRNNKAGTLSVLARRAVVLGLGLTGSQEVIPVLTNCWELNDHVSRETAVAMYFCQGGIPATQRLLAVLQRGATPEGKALAALCLGELYAKERPSRLSRLTNGSNYMMMIPRLSYYREIANEFLHNDLPAPPTEKWETLLP